MDSSILKFMKQINPDDLMCLNAALSTNPIRIDLAYATDEAPNIFGQIYRSDAKLWLHKDLAHIVLSAAAKLHEAYGYTLVLYDGLRTIEAQEKMQKSDIVQANPHWLKEPGRLLSPPGAGAHPRGMAIDVSICAEEGTLLDMGTVFDHLAEDSSPAHNPAHRAYPHHSAQINQNRAILNNAMLGAAEKLGHTLFALPQEWWDFRFDADKYAQYAPLSDTDLPDAMKMV